MSPRSTYPISSSGCFPHLSFLGFSFHPSAWLQIFLVWRNLLFLNEALELFLDWIHAAVLYNFYNHVAPDILRRITNPVPLLASCHISSQTAANFDANERQYLIIIGWYLIPFDEFFKYFCCSSQNNFVNGDIVHRSVLETIEMRSSLNSALTFIDDLSSSSWSISTFNFNALFYIQ